MPEPSRPIRVLSVIEADFISGAAKPLFEFARWCREQSAAPVEPRIVAYRRGAQAESQFIAEVRKAGFALDVIEERGRFDTSVPARLRKLVERHGADILETNNVKSHLFARLSGVWKQRPWVAFHHGFTAEDAKMRLYNLTTRWSLPAAARVVTVCEPFRELLAAQGIDRSRILVQHNPVEPFSPASENEVAAARAHIRAAGAARLLFAAGRLSKEKGHADLLAALARLNGDAHLIIAGEGTERARLEADIRRLGIAKRVTLLGLQGELRPFYMLADVVVLPSHSEGSPNVLLEAMAASRAIVATRVGGIPEIVKHDESALLVEARDPEALAQALKRVLQDDALRQRLGAKAKDVAATHTLESYALARVRLYESCLA